jgi:Leucine-rich repeat (LRR) protein
MISRVSTAMAKRVQVGAWRSWVEFVEMREDARETLQAWNNKILNRLVLSGWKQWTTVVQWQIQQGISLANLDAHKAAWLAEKREHDAVKNNLEAHNERIRQSRIARAVSRLQNACMVLTFDAWKSNYEREKRNRYMIQRCASAMQHRVAVGAWRSWVDFVEWRQEARESLQLWQNKALLRRKYLHFGQWKQVSKDMADEEKFGMSEDKFNELSAAHAELTASKQKIIQTRMARGIAQLKSANKLMCWDALKAFYERGKRNRYMISRVSTAMAKRVQVGAWRSWVEFVEWREDARETLQAWNNKALNRLVLSGWKQWTAVVQWQIHEGITLANLDANREKWLAEKREFESAQNTLEAQRDIVRKNRMARAIARAKNSCLVLTFDAWRLKYEREKRNQYMISRCTAAMTKRTQVSVWRSWVDFVEWREDAREQLQMMQNRVLNRDLDSGFRTWRVAAAYMGTVANGLKSQQELDELQAARDELNASKEKIKENRMARAVATMKNKCMLMCFDAWRTHYERETRNRKMIVRIRAAMLNRTAVKAWRSWMDFMEWREDARDSLQRWSNKVTNRLLVAGWKQWTTVVQWQIQQGISLANLDAHKAAWLAEKREFDSAKNTLEAQRQTVRENRMARAVARMRNSCLVLTFAAWKTDAAKQLRNKRLVAKCAASIAKNKQRAVWSSWVEFVEWREDAREQLQMMQNRVVRRDIYAGWQQWQTFIMISKEEERSELLAKEQAERDAAYSQEMEERESAHAQEMEERDAALAQELEELQAASLQELEAKNEEFNRSKEEMEELAAAMAALKQQEQRTKENRMANAVAKMRMRGAQMCFTTLKEFLVRMKRNRLLVSRFKTALTSRVQSASWRSWVEFAEWRQDARETLSQWCIKVEYREKSMAFNQMKEFARWVREELHKGLTTTQIRDLEAAQAELQNAKNRIRENRIKRAKMKMEHKGAILCFDAWRARYEREKHCQQVLNKAARLMRNKRAAAAWASWHEFIDWRSEARDKVERWQNKVVNKELFCAFGQWSKYCQWQINSGLTLSLLDKHQGELSDLESTFAADMAAKDAEMEEKSAALAQEMEEKEALHLQELEESEAQFAQELKDRDASHQSLLEELESKLGHTLEEKELAHTRELEKIRRELLEKMREMEEAHRRILEEKEEEIRQLHAAADKRRADTEADRQVLMEMFSTNDGDSWVNNDCWAMGSLYKMFGVQMQDGRVHTLDLRDNGLANNLPENLGNLHELQRLFLVNNSLTGRIPLGIMNLQHVQYLHLSNNNFGGQIPGNIGKLKNLLELLLGGNSLSGPIPDSIGSCSELVRLELNGNKLTGKLPETIGQLKKLTFMNLEENNFSGKLPSSLGDALNLEGLDISENNFEGSLPSSIGNLVSLQGFDCSGNKFTGTLPKSIGNCKSIDWVNLAGNQFTGSLPDNICNCKCISVLDISNNQFSGPLPDLTQIPALQEVRVANNAELTDLDDIRRRLLEHFGTKLEFATTELKMRS